jgi:hypothetical protein
MCVPNAQPPRGLPIRLARLAREGGFAPSAGPTQSKGISLPVATLDAGLSCPIGP